MAGSDMATLKYISLYCFQLEEHIVRLREELDREREERNYFQLERDRIHTFWENTDRELEEVKAEWKNLAKDIEEDEGCHQVEIKVRIINIYCSYTVKLNLNSGTGFSKGHILIQNMSEQETRLFHFKCASNAGDR